MIPNFPSLVKVKELYTTVSEGDGDPKGFYEKLGFKISGDYIRDEAVMTFD